MPNETFNELVTAAEESGNPDIAAVMEDTVEVLEEKWPDGEAVDEAMEEDVRMPFHEDDPREDAFSLGMLFGAWAEQEYPDEEAQQFAAEEDEGVDPTYAGDSHYNPEDE